MEVSHGEKILYEVSFRENGGGGGGLGCLVVYFVFALLPHWCAWVLLSNGVK